MTETPATDAAPPAVTIVIPHYDDAVRLARCLDALVPQLTRDVEVLVVDNASPVPPQMPPGIRLLTETEKGAAAARNRGVAEAAADTIFFLDCDCVPAADWLSVARQAATRADLVGGAISVFDETPPPRSGAEAFEAVFAFDNRAYVERKGFSVTANLLTRRDVFEAVGGFRGGLSEDFDWCQRARAAGYVIAYAGDLRVAHPTRSDWPAIRRKWRRLSEESWGLRARSPKARAIWAARALAMPATIVLHAPRVLRHPDLSGTERGRALVMLARLRFLRSLWMLRQAAGGGIA